MPPFGFTQGAVLHDNGRRVPVRAGYARSGEGTEASPLRCRASLSQVRFLFFDSRPRRKTSPQKAGPKFGQENFGFPPGNGRLAGWIAKNNYSRGKPRETGL
jgi:hypothetical protein